MTWDGESRDLAVKARSVLARRVASWQTRRDPIWWRTSGPDWVRQASTSPILIPCGIGFEALLTREETFAVVSREVMSVPGLIAAESEGAGIFVLLLEMLFQAFFDGLVLSELASFHALWTVSAVHV